MSFLKKLFGREKPTPEAEAPAAEAAAPEPAPAESWFSRLSGGLSKSSRSITGSITSIFTKKKLDKATLQDLEDVLLQADLGLPMAERIVKEVATGRYDREIDPEEVKRILAAEVSKVLKPVEVPFDFTGRQALEAFVPSDGLDQNLSSGSAFGEIPTFRSLHRFSLGPTTNQGSNQFSRQVAGSRDDEVGLRRLEGDVGWRNECREGGLSRLERRQAFGQSFFQLLTFGACCRGPADRKLPGPT